MDTGVVQRVRKAQYQTDAQETPLEIHDEVLISTSIEKKDKD